MSRYAPRHTWDALPSRVERNTERLFDLFSEQNAKATFFFLGWVAERYPHLVRRAVELGHEIGCHSYAHHPVFRLTPEEFRSDTLRALRAIEDAGGVEVTSYRAPSFSIVRSAYWAFDILADLGFSSDSSVNPVRHPFYGNPTAPRRPWPTSAGIVEYPIATWRAFGHNLPVGGGAYLRILPYQLVRGGIRSLNREGSPAVIYLHPWEIDPSQPRIATQLSHRIRQYRGLATMESKLRRLLNDFEMSSMTKAFAHLPFPSPRLATRAFQQHAG